MRDPFHREKRRPGIGPDIGSSAAARHLNGDGNISPYLGVDLRWIDIDTDVSLNGSDIGTVQIDPLVYGAYVRTHF